MRDYSYICYYEDELYHHGILGQRWGIRRFQNKDGTLTPRGKKRAEKLQKEYESLTGNKEFASKPKPRSISDMSDEELMNARNRMLVENAYLDAKRQYSETKLRDMNAEANYNAAYAEAHKTKGDRLKEKLKESLSKTWTDMVQPALLTAGKDSLTKYMTKTLNEVMGNNKVDPNSIEGLKATFDKLDYQVKIKGKLAELKGEQKPKSDLEKLKEEAEKMKQEANISSSKVTLQKNKDYFTNREEKLAEKASAEKERKQQEKQEQQQAQREAKEATKQSVKEDANTKARQATEAYNAYNKADEIFRKNYSSMNETERFQANQVLNMLNQVKESTAVSASVANLNLRKQEQTLAQQGKTKVNEILHPVKTKRAYDSISTQAKNAEMSRKVAEEWLNSSNGKEALNNLLRKGKQ